MSNPSSFRPARRRWTDWIGQHLARLHYAVRIEPTWLERTTIDVVIEGLPTAFDGFRIAHLTDLHASSRIPARYLQEAIQLAQHAAPDLIALTGDFIHKGYRHVAEVAEVLTGLWAPHGCLAVLGNHDFSVRNALGIRRYPGLHRAVEQALTRCGVRVLRNEWIELERSGERLTIGGVDDLWSRECDVARALGGSVATRPRLLLAHNPLTVHHLDGQRCDLLLSGHTHGGQIDWPGLGRVTLSRRARRLAAGLYHIGSTQVYVNKGVGFGVRFRFRVRPEVAILTLRCATPALCSGSSSKL